MVSAGTAAMETIAVLEKLEAIQRQLDGMKDRSAIEDLMVEYNRACDAPQDKGRRIAACFTEDGTWQSTGKHGNPEWAAVGRPALVKKFERNIERMPFSAHFLTNGTVQVDGEAAAGSWAYFQTATYRDRTALWIAGTYRVEFRRTGNAWLIAHLEVDNWFTTPYASGWADVEHVPTP